MLSNPKSINLEIQHMITYLCSEKLLKNLFWYSWWLDERLQLRSRRRPGVIFAREGIAMAAPKAKPEAKAADALWYGYYS